MHIRPVLLALALVLVLPARAMADGGTISGTVAVDGQVSSGLCVAVFDSAENSIDTVTTDGFGVYHVYVDSPGYYSVRFDDCGAGYTTAQWTSGIEIVSDVDNNGVDGSLQAAGIVRGYVEDEHGAGLTGACVSTEDHNGNTTGETTTDAVGYYVIKGVLPGQARVQFRGCSAGNYVPEYDDVTVNPGETTAGVDAALTAAGRITGYVHNAKGQPIQNVCVNGSVDGAALTGAIADWTGRYVMSEVPPAGTYDLTASDCFGTTYMSLRKTGTLVDPVGDTTQDFTLSRPAFITGHVRDGAGNLLASICVTAKNADSGAEVKEKTAPNGYYEVNGVRPGTYDLTFGDCSSGGEWVSATKAGMVVADGATLFDVDQVLRHPDPPAADTPAGDAGVASAGAASGSADPAADPATTAKPLPPARCSAPKLVGLSLAKAKKALTAAGCRLGKVTRHAARRGTHGKRRVRKGVVLRQNAAGSRVALTVSR